MLFVSFLLIFVPSKKNINTSQIGILKVFFAVQTLFLLIYFFSGLYKFSGLVSQEMYGMKTALSPDSLAQHVATTIFSFNTTYYFFSSFVLKYQSYFFSVALIIGYFIELLSVYIIFKPKLHRLWGGVLILLHAFILMIFGPDFTLHLFIVALFLFFSPFSDSPFNLKNEIKLILNSLKGIFVKSKKINHKIVIFYDGDCLLCNRFLNYLSKFDLPSRVGICQQQGLMYKSHTDEYPDLIELDSVVIVEYKENKEKYTRVKADAVTWLLSKIKKRFVLMRCLYLIAPFVGNVIYSLIAKNRKKLVPESCPVLPQKIQSHIINESIHEDGTHNHS